MHKEKGKGTSWKKERDATITGLQSELRRLQHSQTGTPSPAVVRSELANMACVLCQNTYCMAAEALRHRVTAQRAITVITQGVLIQMVDHHSQIKGCGCMTAARADLRPAGEQWLPETTEATLDLTSQVMGSAILAQNMPVLGSGAVWFVPLSPLLSGRPGQLSDQEAHLRLLARILNVLPIFVRPSFVVSDVHNSP